jgi:hypothetical protein
MRPVPSQVLDAAFARWAARTLDALLRIVQLERDGRPFEPDALRLRTTPVPSSAIPHSKSASELISPALAAREEPRPRGEDAMVGRRVCRVRGGQQNQHQSLERR